MIHRVHGLVVISGAVAAVSAAVSFAGCFFDPGYDDCSLYPGAGCGSPSTTTTTGTGGGGGDGGQPPDCAGDPTQDPALVRDECGVFVSASAVQDGDGSKTRPFKTIADAAASAGVKRIFACAEVYNEAATVSFTGGVDIYAGFANCASASGWSWQPTSFATLNGAPDLPALVLDGGASHIENLHVVAAEAALGGGSSIAMIVNGGTLDMPNGSLEAKAAKAGDPGAYVADDMMLDGEPGEPGVGICDSGASNPGPTGKTKVCASSDGSTAGNGGDGGGLTAGTPDPAGSGTDGTPPDVSQPTKGVGGIGEGQGTPVACDIGQPGANGVVGSSGAGASGAGALSASGYSGSKGGNGTNGKPGQGGGGGGGAKGATSIACNTVTQDRVGASGGAGGTGGCGGALGGGGNPGGSSIALVSLDATITLGQVTLKAGLAGDGGKGGDGQSGGQKGPGGGPGAGKGTANGSCRGGDGGQGGAGGPGGGGQGGHSLGIAFKGKAPTGGTVQIDMANKGKGGPGGNGNSAADNGKGADGAAAIMMSFD